MASPKPQPARGVPLFLYSGAGNVFLVADGRDAARQQETQWLRERENIRALCSRHHTDGLMLLAPAAPGTDFSMEYYNPDGSGGMMCGNGGRCITVFARRQGIVPGGTPENGGQRDDASGVEQATYRFLAPDGIHTAEILEEGHADAPVPSPWTVRLHMRDVQGVRQTPDGLFLDTGTRHLVVFVDEVDKVDVQKSGSLLRHNPAYAPEGTNVNFVQSLGGGKLRLRTFEKGVERETLACGTGITASALAASHKGIVPLFAQDDALAFELQCRRGDWLSVQFQPNTYRTAFCGVSLTGPVEELPLVAQ